LDLSTYSELSLLAEINVSDIGSWRSRILSQFYSLILSIEKKQQGGLVSDPEFSVSLLTYNAALLLIW